MRKAEITKAIGYKAELQTAIVRDECGYLAGPIKGLLAGFDSGLKGKEGVSVNYFCLIAKRFLVDKIGRASCRERVSSPV